ncbi:MAG TPA: hypothetical protein ENG80_00815 [Nitrospirae bacterium]|nr:hypothetical protein [Nitrospirota bacterium]HDH51254.1 hypothetical protein [Nitrospirota bacterium]HDK81035.1 hypothetical protein [Nitrospirota bacterium]
MWIAILKKQVDDKGPKQVAKELAVSRSTVDLVCQGKYQASTKKIEAKIKAIYGHNGKIPCPVLEEITPARCVETWQRAKKIGMMAGNPETLKLYKTCINCPVRNS